MITEAESSYATLALMTDARMQNSHLVQYTLQNTGKLPL